MASILRVNTLTDASSNNSVAMSTVAGGTAKTWINLDGDAGTPAALLMLSLQILFHYY